MTSFHLGRTMIVGMLLPASIAGQATGSLISSNPTLPEACAREVSSSTGQPYMLTSKRNVQLGLSFRPSVPGEVLLAIWVSNPANEEAAVMTCSDLETFFFFGFDVLSQDGIRLPSKQEVETRKGPSSDDSLVCARNIVIRVPPRSCIHGDLDRPDYDFVKDLSKVYALKPGSYTITPRLRTGEHRRSTTALTIKVMP